MGAEDIGGLTARKTKKESKHNYIIRQFSKSMLSNFGEEIKIYYVNHATGLKGLYFIWIGAFANSYYLLVTKSVKTLRYVPPVDFVPPE